MLKLKIRDIIDICRLKNYQKRVPVLLQNIRNKETIRTVFVIHEVAMWKTENLYIAMKKHPRFEPIICVALTNEDLPRAAVDKYHHLIEYLDQKKYEYKEIRFIRELSPDITFYGKTYTDVYANTLWIQANSGLIFHQQYGFMNTNMHTLFNHELLNYATQFFVENEIMVRTISPHLMTRGKNLVITGTTIMDELMKPKNNYENPWKNQSSSRKRIIWAPHFSIKQDTSWVSFSSFLEVCDDMLKIAGKYENEVQFAFKPHPLLYTTLIKEWGIEKTDAYFNSWKEMSNSQLEEGRYMGLMKHSDAMIHDCGSFMMEYLYMHKPVSYTLVRSKDLAGLNDFAKAALDVHYKIYNFSQIEEFIKNIIAGKDAMYDVRENFYKTSLIPPHGKSACENIINSVLGIEEYKS